MVVYKCRDSLKLTYKEQQLLVESLRKQLDDDELMLRFMERKIDASRTTHLEGRAGGSSFASGPIDVSLVGTTSKKQKNPTLKDHMKGVISRIAADQEFTVTQLETILKDLGQAPDGKHARNRISVLVKEFAGEGLLLKSHIGKGSEPHRYKRSAQAS